MCKMLYKQHVSCIKIFTLNYSVFFNSWLMAYLRNTSWLPHSFRCHAMEAFSGPAVAIFKSESKFSYCSCGKWNSFCMRWKKTTGFLGRQHHLRWVKREALIYLYVILISSCWKPLLINVSPVTTAQFCTITADQHQAFNYPSLIHSRNWVLLCVCESRLLFLFLLSEIWQSLDWLKATFSPLKSKPAVSVTGLEVNSNLTCAV